MTEPVSPGAGHAGTAAPAEGEAAPAVAPVVARQPWSPMDVARRFAIIGIWVLLAAAFAGATPLFLRQGTAQIIFGANGELVFLCMAALCPLCVGEFDFSIASVMGLSGTTTAVMYASNDHPIMTTRSPFHPTCRSSGARYSMASSTSITAPPNPITWNPRSDPIRLVLKRYNRRARQSGAA